MVSDDEVARSKAIQRRTGKTFHFATRLLPERVRHPTYVLYAFFRLADEVVDAAETAPPEEQRERLERLRAEALGRQETNDSGDSEWSPPSADPVLRAFSELRERYGIADDDVNVFVDAMLSDIDTDRYATYEELEAYMDGSAAAVGRMMVAIMEPENPDRALPHATALGEAFQLTNFVRDVREDVVDRDRVYLPEETLHAHGVDPEQVRRLEFDDRVAGAVRTELRRAEGLYRDGVAGIQYLPEDCQFAVLLSAVLYAEHHRLIRKRGYDVVSATPQLGRLRMVAALARTRMHWALSSDPTTVFERVSAVRSDDRVPEVDHTEGLPTQ
ncbi:phytoene/squalene synthase family protein [Halobium salinum]|uniref:Phytoene/squalene synthase family protein n=1 Tax=Halobium salinum TaxID=1364940 RepID=A0ABD5P9N8_9EURY|nr:phytoene/squalene synthase family protein [Halobium salinum]